MVYAEREHTADILMYVRASNLQELFSEAAHALMDTLYRGEAEPVVAMTISVDGETREQLLHVFLSELLFICETENIVFSEVSVSIDADHLSATLTGEPFDMLRHGGGTEVKGISFSGLVISCDQEVYECEVLFDV